MFDTALGLCLVFGVEQAVQPEPPDSPPTIETPPPTKRWWPWRLALRALIGVVVVSLVYGFYVWSGLPPRSEVSDLKSKIPVGTSVMRQRASEALRSGRPALRTQQWVPLTRVSRHLIHAVVVAEDPKFFGHEGVDWDAVRESIETNVRKRRFARGASTITQQLAKNLFLTTRKSVTRKLRELIVARWLEEDLSKRRILELYLNVIEWGDGLFGCEAAAHHYYHKSAAQLSQAEAAGLAAMIPNPLKINPRVNPRRHASAQRRILRLMSRGSGVKRHVRRFGTVPMESSPAPSPESEPSPEPELAVERVSDQEP